MQRTFPLTLILLSGPHFGCNGDSATPEDTSPCDGQRGTVYPDADGDGYGVEAGAVEGCIPAVEGFAEEAGDCDDQNSQTNPGMEESCLTEGDDNCDDVINDYPPGSHFPRPEGCTNYYLDNDGDGYGQYDDDECMCAPVAPYTLMIDHISPSFPFASL